jgi:hypothetical protein
VPITSADVSFLTGSTLYRQNGRYIYSLRGSGSSMLDVYDLAANTWINAVAYGNQTETFSTGSCSIDFGGYIYIQKEGTGRFFRFDIAKNALEPWATNIYPQSTTVEGDKIAVIPYKDGATVIPYLYTQLHNRTELMRMMVIG